jgi:peptidoglycan/LPS O-acetylase OafA/YrhL
VDQPRATVLPERNLDFLRAIAVLAVLLDHIVLSLGDHRDNRFLLWMGQAGLCAFFVHTSLVLMSSLERDLAPDQPGWQWRFYVRRFWRIYPLAWAILAVCVVLKVPAGLLPATYTAVTVPQVLANAALSQDLLGQPNVLNVMWTLTMEVQMYVVLPACFVLARRRATWPVVLMVVAGCALMTAYFWGNQAAHRIPGVWRIRVLSFVPCFLMGVAAYHGLRRRGDAPKPFKGWAWVPVILVPFLLFFPAFNWVYWIGRTGFAIVLASLIPFVADIPDGWVAKASHVVATYSYGLYLVHPLALRTGFGLLGNQPMAIQWVAMTATLVGGCWVAYHYVEQPGVRFARRLLQRRRAAS